VPYAFSACTCEPILCREWRPRKLHPPVQTILRVNTTQPTKFHPPACYIHPLAYRDKRSVREMFVLACARETAWHQRDIFRVRTPSATACSHTSLRPRTSGARWTWALSGWGGRLRARRSAAGLNGGGGTRTRGCSAACARWCCPPRCRCRSRGASAAPRRPSRGPSRPRTGGGGSCLRSSRAGVVCVPVRAVGFSNEIRAVSALEECLLHPAAVGRVAALRLATCFSGGGGR
ncbi:hypothetical protein LXA43DRAFT_1161412, partial [Ganoderma leucocontextum]